MRRSKRPLRTTPRLSLAEAERRVREALETDAHRYDVNRFLLERGTAWEPVERPADVPAGERHDAFRNCHRLAVARDLTYCEGFTLPRGYTEAPNRHAWCLDDAGAVVDPSPGWADPGRPLRECYFGVAIEVGFAAPYAGGDGPAAPKGVLYELTGRIHELAAALDTGVCGAQAPPVVGSQLTGTGLTLEQAAVKLERGESVALTDVQRRIVERWAIEHRP